jgi:hypothetical protein
MQTLRTLIVTNTTDPVLPLSDRAIEALDRFLCTAFPPPRRVPDRFIFGAAIDPPPGIRTRSLRQLSYDAARHPLARR